MPVSNTTLNILASDPYWDDFTRSKRFYRTLFMPKTPVQVRELNQVQSSLQNQIEQLGTGIFKEGAAVSGGNFTFANNVVAVQVVRDDNVDVNTFYTANTGVGAVLRGLTSAAEGRVVQVSRQSTEDYSALIITPLTASTFTGGEAISVVDSSTNSSMAIMTLAPAPVQTRNAATFSVESGVFFLRGVLVDVERQSLVLNTATSLVSSRLGFVITETIITPADDTSLLDPAFGASNYAAPGARRLQLTATLDSRPIVGTSSIEQNSDQNFVEIARVINGVLAHTSDRLQQEFVEDTLARRTYDESGDYIVRPFRLTIKDHNPPMSVPNMTGTITGNTTSTTITSGGVDTVFQTEANVDDVLVVNGEQRSIASITSNSVMIVNSAFSAAFTNVSAVLISPNKLNLDLDAGKAYIRGYEFETLGTTKLSADRPRTTAPATNEAISTLYGPYVFVTKDNTALLDISTMQQVDLHMVPFTNVDNTSASLYSSTKIGTAYARSFVYNSGIGDANTVYKLYLVNAEFQNKTYTINTSGANATTLTANVTVNSTTNVITLVQNSTSSTASILPIGGNVTAFIGARVLLYNTMGGQQYYDIINANTYHTANVSTTTLQVASTAFFDVVNAAANVSVVFTDKAIRGIASNVSKTAGASVSVLSKVGNISLGNTVFSDTASTNLLFPFGNSWVKPNTIADLSYQATRYFSSVATGGTSNGTHTQFTLTIPAGETFYPTTTVYSNFVVANSTGYNVPLLATGASSANVAITGSTATLFLPTSAVATGAISVYARVQVTTSTPRTKTLVFANTNTSSVTVTSGNVISDLTKGHIGINTINSTSSAVLSLGVADVYRVRYVYATPTPSSVSTWVDVTNRYDLDNGQRDWCYDHSALVLKPGYAHHSAGNLLAMVDRFSPSSSNGYFTALSYTGSGLTDDYGDIPNFTNTKSGVTTVVRDCIDFRPIRTSNVASANTANNPYVNTTAVFDAQVFPFPDSTITVDYEYYLPRMDRVVLTKNRQFKVITGVPNIHPQAAADVQDGITLYLVSYPPYVITPEAVQVVAFEYRRYTMKDIGKLEKRIENLEYYVQLNQVEQQTLNTPELDANDQERFKNGILVDPFVSSAVANVLDLDYAASIDEQHRELRPSFDSYAWKLNNFWANNSTNIQKIGTSFVTVAYTTDSIVKQPLASKRVNVNPFNVASWVGSVRMVPASDTWYDTQTLPSVNVNLFGENDAWLASPEQAFGTVWNDWEEHWSGVTTTSSTTWQDGGLFATPQAWDTYKTVTAIQTTTDLTGTKSRSGAEISAKSSTITKDLGDRVVDISVVPYIRASSVAIDADGLKPGSHLTAFFDDQDVTAYVEQGNSIILATNAAAELFTLGEIITSNGSPVTGSGILLSRSSNVLHIVNASGVFYTTGGGVSITGATSGAVATVSDYTSMSGLLQGVTNSTTITLDAGASAVTNSYVGNTVFITSGSTVQRRVISAYVGATKVATLSSPYEGTLTAGATYSIGDLVADELPTSVSAKVAAGDPYFTYFPAVIEGQRPGKFAGMFRIPAGTFVTGSHIFRLADNPSSVFATSHSDGHYNATGYTRTVENQTISTRNVDFVSKPVTSGTVSLTPTSIQQTSFVQNEYYDPLAETFLIDATKYPDGVFIDSVDLFFGKKDTSNLPVKVQIRPTINGYPSADVVLAQSELYAANVNVVSSGSINADSSSHRTRFGFTSPVYMLPGQEYALVVMSNSFEYELYVGEMGQQIVGDTRIIAQQPYGGSFFKSQNARTWTPEQNEDLMFVINRAVFSTAPATAFFTLGESAATTFDYDVINVQTGHLDFAPTINSSGHTLRLVDADTVTFESGYTTIGVEQNVIMDQRKEIPASNTTAIQLQANLQTTTDAVAPIYDLDRLSITTVKNVVDDGGLYANGFVVVNSGTMTSPSANTFALTITGVGSGAVVNAYTNSTGAIVSFTVSAAGSAYTQTPTVVLSNTMFSTAPTITYVGETSPKSAIVGEQKGRYITRQVTLADGFDASDLKVYFSANRPSGTTIDVYYKVLATGDVESFDQKSWTLMTITPAVASVYTPSPKQFKEFSYTTAGHSASYTSNGAEYSRFHTFAIKVVMRSIDPVKVPRIRNLRVIALDE